MLVPSCRMMHVVRPVVVLLCLLLYADAESKFIIHLCLGFGHHAWFCFQLVITKSLRMSFLLSDSSKTLRSSLDHNQYLKKIVYATSLLFLLLHALFLKHGVVHVRWWKPLSQSYTVKTKTSLAQTLVKYLKYICHSLNISVLTLSKKKTKNIPLPINIPSN